MASAWEQRAQEHRWYPKEYVQKKSRTSRQGEWSLESLEEALASKKEEWNFEEETKLDEGGSLQRLSLDDELPETDTASLASISVMAWQRQTMGYSFTVNERNDLLPLPIPLRVRRSRRCRAELAEGRPGILLKPKLNPLEGDSSLRTGHGQWWRKVRRFVLWY